MVPSTHLHCNLQIVHIHVELQEVPVKGIVCEVKKVIGPPLDVINDLLHPLDHSTQPLNVRVLGKAAELMDGAEELLQLAAAPCKQLKLAKDLGLIEGTGALLITAGRQAVHL